ncbi:MAG: hypothetical protein ABSH33_02840 [Steroidobacteraceae bacterium]|jgi:hypothetical protein
MTTMQTRGTINEFELGKTRIMAEAREALRRIGIEYHCIMFDIHASQPAPDGATLTVTAEGSCVSGWFPADEIEDSRDHVGRPDVRHKIASLVARVKESVAS